MSNAGDNRGDRKRVGIVGGGQLGQMMGIAASALDVDCVFVDPGDTPPASSAGKVLRCEFDDMEGLTTLAEQTDVITYEFENVPVSALRELQRVSRTKPVVYPPLSALEQAQDRLREKTLFESLHIPVAPYAAVDSAQDAVSACERIGAPLVLKTRRMGYDGKGQRVVRDKGDAAALAEQLGGCGLIAEQWVPFDREVSVIGTRATDGDIVLYPLVENVHRDGILHTSIAPASGSTQETKAQEYLVALLEHLDYVGTLTLELFVAGSEILANEMAPRVHNSGHWTIEGAVTSQFDNHIRAVLGHSLGSADARGYAGMLNLIGQMPAKSTIEAISNAAWHDYGKSARPGRKLGHVTVVADTAVDRDRRLRDLETQVPRRS